MEGMPRYLSGISDSHFSLPVLFNNSEESPEVVTLRNCFCLLVCDPVQQQLVQLTVFPIVKMTSLATISSLVLVFLIHKQNYKKNSPLNLRTG